MILEEALRCLFLRHLRAQRLATADAVRAASLQRIAEKLRVSRDRDAGEFVAELAGREWRIPQGEFIFYTRGDRPADAANVSAEDAQYERNLASAEKWLAVFQESQNA